jgi:hypothetical protein
MLHLGTVSVLLFTDKFSDILGTVEFEHLRGSNLLSVEYVAFDFPVGQFELGLDKVGVGFVSEREEGLGGV